MGTDFCFRQPETLAFNHHQLYPTRFSNLYLLHTMPAARSKRGKKSKATAAPVPKPEPIPEPEPEVVQTADDDNAMQTDQPESSSSTSLVETAANIVATAEAVVVNVAEGAVETVENVVEAASEFIEEMTMEEKSQSTSRSGNATPGDSEKEEANKMTTEERKAKLDELRKKMVRLFLLAFMNPIKSLNNRPHPQKRIVHL